MKTLLKIFFLMAVISLVAGCNETDEFNTDEDFQLKSAQHREITVPFEANLLGVPSLDREDTDCIDEGYVGRAIVECSGTATHMGKVSWTFDFCTAGPPDPNIEGSIMTYAGSIGELVAANGDVLYLTFPGGSIINGRLDHHPDHVYGYWGGTMTVLGGTGKFEGAKGELTEDDYGSTLDDYTHHRFYGEITLIKGKK